MIGLDLPFVADAATAIEQMRRLLAGRGIAQAIFLGASFSGFFVQAYARRYPARTRALILSHTGALDPARAERVRTHARRAAKVPLVVLRGLLRVVVRLLLRGVTDRRFWIARYDAALAAITRDALVSRYLLEASIEDLRGQPWSGDVLVIHSDNDAIAKPQEQQRLRRDIPAPSGPNSSAPDTARIRAIRPPMPRPSGNSSRGCGRAMGPIAELPR